MKALDFMRGGRMLKGNFKQETFFRFKRGLFVYLLQDEQFSSTKNKFKFLF